MWLLHDLVFSVHLDETRKCCLGKNVGPAGPEGGGGGGGGGG